MNSGDVIWQLAIHERQFGCTGYVDMAGWLIATRHLPRTTARFLHPVV